MLTKEEVKEFLELLNDPDIVAQTATYIFTGIDIDSSGLIDEEEFIDGLKIIFGIRGNELTNEQIKRALEKVDTDRDHKISRVELKTLVKKFIDSLKEIVEGLG